MSQMFRVGVVSSMHGVKGAVKVFPTTDDPRRFDLLKHVFFGNGDREEEAVKELKIERVQYFKNMVIVKFEGIDRIEDAEGLRGGSLWIPDEEAIPTGEDEFYIRDFLDAEVVDESGEVLGTVRDIWETGSNFVLDVIDTDNKQLLIPVIKDCIRELNKEQKRIIVHLLKGMRGEE